MKKIMKPKSLFKKCLATGAFVLGMIGLPEAKAHDIILSCDYFENKRNMAQIEYVFSEPSSDISKEKDILEKHVKQPVLAQSEITSAKDYYEYVRAINAQALSKNERIHKIALLGNVASYNYDYSLPNNKVSSQQIFSGIQDFLNTGKPMPNGAICGGIHEFTKKAAQELGIDAVTYFGRTGKEGSGHVFTSMLGDYGFVNQNYGQLLHTNTFNFYKALSIAQQVEGSVVLDHQVYDNEFLFHRITPEGQHFFRFIRFDPLLENFINTMEKGVEIPNGGHIVLGNNEVSGAYDLTQKYLTVSVKGGRIYGQPISALKTADMFEGVLRLTYEEKKQGFFDTRLGMIYSMFDQVYNKQQLIFIVTEMQGGGYIPIAKETNIFLGMSLFGSGGIPIIEYAKADAVTMMIINLNTFISLDKGPFSVYAASQVMKGSNNVEEQEFTVYLGDIEVGTTYKCPFGKTRFAFVLKPEAYCPRVSFENKNFSVGLDYGIGRYGVFTPNYFEINTTGNVCIGDFISKKSENEKRFIDNLYLSGQISARHEQWSHGETDTSGTLQTQIKADF